MKLTLAFFFFQLAAGAQTAAPQQFAVRVEVAAVTSKDWRQNFSLSPTPAAASEPTPVIFVLGPQDLARLEALRRRDACRSIWRAEAPLAFDGQLRALLGGEFPLSVVTYDQSANRAAETIRFKEYGVGVRLRPLGAAGEGVLFEVAPEISLIDLRRQVSFAGYIVPSLAARRLTRRIALDLGQTVAVADLLSEDELSALARAATVARPRQATQFAALRQYGAEAGEPIELIFLLTPERRGGTSAPPVTDAKKIDDEIIGPAGFATALGPAPLP